MADPGRLPDFGDVSAGGTHLHHYLWGILLLAGVAIFGMVDRSPRARTWMGLALGIALALIVDEAALLITLRDVYWQTEGWPSVALGVVLIGLVGTGLVVTRSGPRSRGPTTPPNPNPNPPTNPTPGPKSRLARTPDSPARGTCHRDGPARSAPSRPDADEHSRWRDAVLLPPPQVV